MAEILISNDLKCMTFSKNDISRIENEAYNQALEDVEERFKEWLKSEYGMVTDEDMLTIRVLRSLKRQKNF